MNSEAQPSLRLTIVESSQIGEARRQAITMARAAAADEVSSGQAGIVATELASNLVKHAGGGELLLRTLFVGDTPHGIELLALDRGPGMDDLGRCLADGYSTAGSPGTGLGAIGRLSKEFDVYSVPGKGTVLVARFWFKSQPSDTPDTGVICVPLVGETVSGDAWNATRCPQTAKVSVLVADGLGHGPLAAEASQQAVMVCEQEAGKRPAEVIRLAHGALRSTRGAAVAIAEIDPEARTLRFCGVGNISATILAAGDQRSLVSHNGTVGHQLHKSLELLYPWPEGAMLVMHSDGLSGRWTLGNYPGLSGRHPSIIAGVLYRDFGRGRDDATVVVVRDEPLPLGGMEDSAL